MSPLDRNLYTPKHPRAATASPSHIEPESSQAIEDPEARAAWRAQQEHVERTAKLEDKHDKLADAHQALAVEVARMDGKLDVLVTSAEASDAERKARRQREIDDAVALEKQRARRAVWWKQLFKVIGSIVGASVTIYGIYRGVR